MDGGKTFTLLPAPHGDHHGLWIDPTNPKSIINGNDGGATVSVDGGQTWSTLYNQPTAQFYHVITDNQFPYYVYGAQQDNSSVGIASYSDEGVITDQNWFDVRRRDRLHRARPAAIRTSSTATTTSRRSRRTASTRRTQQTQDVSPWPLDVSGHGAEDLDGYRFNWTSPLFISPHDANALYTAGNRVFKSTDAGMTWTAISKDLTRNDKSKQLPSGGPITLDITAVEYYDTIFASPSRRVQKGELWAGTDDGLVWLTRDDGKHLDQRDAESAAGVEHGQHHRPVAARCRHGLHGGGPSQARRSEALYL